MHQYERKVRKDGSVQYAGNVYEVPFEHVGRTVTLIVDPGLKEVHCARYQDTPVSIVRQDLIGNAHRCRQRPPIFDQTNASIKDPNNLVEALYEKAKRDLALDPTDQ